jgi:hypothetical protein
VEAPEREFRAPGGTGLIPRNGAALVVLPGSGSNRSAVLGQAAVLARHGNGALLAEGSRLCQQRP